MVLGNLFYEVAVILSIATLFGFFGQKLRQPLIIMFLIAGVFAGPAFLNVINSYGSIELLAQIGIALLLFIVGLRLDVSLIKSAGPVALATGIGQILFTCAIGLAITMGLGLSFVNALYTSIALTFSSTIIVVKLLSDKKEINSLHGQISVGFLIVQDIAAILVLIGLATFSAQTADTSFLQAVIAISLKGVGLFLGLILLVKYVMPGLMFRLAYSQELLVLFSIAWAVSLSAFSEYLGFSKEVGAFLAGISLASTHYRDNIAIRLSTLRDFLLLFFFINLGLHLDWSTVGSQINIAVILSLFVLIGNPLVVLIIMGLMGYRSRTGFLAGLTVAQISEFSLIVVALGLSLGHIVPETMGLVTLVGITTICVSTYMILYSDYLYNRLAKVLKFFERKNPYRETENNTLSKINTVDIILIGLGDYGRNIAEHLLLHNKKFIAVDFDPRVLQQWRARQVPVMYGDISDPDFYEHLPLSKASWIISSLRNKNIHNCLMQQIKKHKYQGKVALTANSSLDAEFLQKIGAQVVFRPFADAAEQAVSMVLHAMEFLPQQLNWPIAFKEITLHLNSVFNGCKIRSVPLRANTGVSIIAVSRGGETIFNPHADFILLDGDRLVIVGPPNKIKDAVMLLGKTNVKTEKVSENAQFRIARISFKECSLADGCSLTKLSFRQNYDVTVIGIEREAERIIMPNPNEQLKPGDHLIVIGVGSAIKKLLEQEAMQES